MTSRLSLFILLLAGAVSAHAFTFTDSKGKTQSLDQYKGKWVLVNFWATWCPPCLEEIPDLVALHDDKKNNLVVIGVALDYRDPKEVLQFSDQMMISYPMVLGTHKLAAQVGAIPGLPTTYLFNPQGKQVAYNVGAVTRDAIERYIRNKK
ncbi:MAG: TlpA disulfide reductase family protein [Pseudomonadota bacterium]|nr:TlpA disulfide reductase family protein [Pseudomonadota bacterium]MDP1572672.1 TlpA disulfide reductase family protein [Pseudomonadota bacterium]MDP1906545.1 TlpA disulfide reductase family protein [Pseudomonadota bacterium]